MTQEKASLFGTYRSLNQHQLQEINNDHRLLISKIQVTAKKNALMTVAILPLVMVAGFLILMLHFKLKGGYKPCKLIE